MMPAGCPRFGSRARSPASRRESSCRLRSPSTAASPSRQAGNSQREPPVVIAARSARSGASADAATSSTRATASRRRRARTESSEHDTGAQSRLGALAADVAQSPAQPRPRAPARLHSVPLAQGFRDSEHLVELIGSSSPSVARRSASTRIAGRLGATDGALAPQRGDRLARSISAAFAESAEGGTVGAVGCAASARNSEEERQRDAADKRQEHDRPPGEGRHATMATANQCRDGTRAAWQRRGVLLRLQTWCVRAC